LTVSAAVTRRRSSGTRATQSLSSHAQVTVQSRTSHCPHLPLKPFTAWSATDDASITQQTAHQSYTDGALSAHKMARHSHTIRDLRRPSSVAVRQVEGVPLSWSRCRRLAGREQAGEVSEVSRGRAGSGGVTCRRTAQRRGRDNVPGDRPSLLSHQSQPPPFTKRKETNGCKI